MVATATVAVTLLGASWLLLTWVEADLLDSAQGALDAALDAQAEQFGLSSEFIEPALFEASIDGENVFISVFDPGDGELAFGEMFVDDEPVASLIIDTETEEIVEVWDISFFQPITNPTEVERIESLANELLELGENEQFLVGATDLEEIAESVDAVRGALWILGPGLLAAFGLLTWWLVGRALQPVNSITRQVEAISSSSLDRRVPVPDSGDELANLATVMNRMLDRLQRGGDRQRQFAADASHELRSPLSTIRVAGEMLGSNPNPDRTQRLADDIVAESVRMDELIGDLLDLSRLEEDQRLADREEVDLVALIKAELSGEVERGAVTIEAPSGQTAQAALLLNGSSRQLRRVVRNLVDNALRHADSKVVVSVTGSGLGSVSGSVAGQSDGMVRLMVDDDGAGVAQAERQNIFERFSRLDEARSRDAGGSGLGLSLVMAIAESHGGTVSVTDSELGGARFVVTLPAG